MIKFTILCIVAALCAAQAKKMEPIKLMHSTELGTLAMIIPIHSDFEQSLTEEHREMWKMMLEEIYELFEDLLKALGRSRLDTWLNSVAYGVKADGVLKTIFKRREMFNLKTSNAYNCEQVELFKKIMEMSKAAAKDESEPVDAVRLVVRAKTFMATLRKLIAMSPMGHHLDWANGEVDFMPLPKYLSKIFGDMRRVGLGGHLNALEQNVPKICGK